MEELGHPQGERSEREGAAPAPQQPPAPVRRSPASKWLKIAVIVEGAVIVFLLLLLMGAFLVVAVSGLGMGGPEFTEEVVRPGDRERRIVLLPVTGPLILASEGGGFYPASGSTQWSLSALRRLAKDRTVSAVVLEIATPGGSITASDLLHRQVLAARGSGKKVVAMLGGLAASGGYYVASASDKIIALPTTVTGCIGVILQSFEVHELLGKIGVEPVTVKSGRLKDMGSPFRPLSEEERSILQSLSDEAYDRFVSIVAEGRGMEKDEVKTLADGRLLTASQARRAGLVDEIGYPEDAIELAEKLSGARGAHVVRYRRRVSLVEMFFGERKTYRGMFPGLSPFYMAREIRLPSYSLYFGVPGSSPAAR